MVMFRKDNRRLVFPSNGFIYPACLASIINNKNLKTINQQMHIAFFALLNSYAVYFICYNRSYKKDRCQNRNTVILAST